MLSKNTYNTINRLTAFAVVFVVLVSIPLFSFAAGADDKANVGPYIPGGLEGIIYSMSVGIGGFFLWLGGALLDYAVKELVVEMGEYMRGGVGLAVDTLWVAVRDMFNVIFIFGIIYIGFRVILFSEDSQIKKTLGFLIVAALMINFSLFITKAIVDFSNATASQIYSKSVSTEKIDKGGYKPVVAQSGSRDTAGISYSFMNMFRMTTYASGDAIKDYQDRQGSILGAGRLAFFGILMMFVMLIAAFVFAAGAFLMVSRFIGLIIFMIFSPAMFAGFVFPHKMFSEYMHMWWRKFLQYAFVGPAYLFMLYLALFVLASGIDFETGGGFAAAFTADSFDNSAFIIFLHFFIVAGFLIAALLVAQKMGAYGADASIGMLKGAGKYLKGEAQGLAGRNTIGRISSGVDKQLEKRGYSRRGTLRSLASTGASAKFGSRDSRKDIVDANKEAGRKGARFAKLNDTTDKVISGAAAPLGETGDAARVASEKAILGSDTETLTKMLKSHKPGSAEYEHIVATMRPDQYDAVMKQGDEDFSLSNKDALGGARTNAITSEVQHAAFNSNENIGPLSRENALETGIGKAEMSQLVTLGAAKIEEHAGKLTAAQIDSIKKGKEFTPTEKSRIVKAHETQLIEQFNSSPESVFKGRKDADVAKLPKDILKDEHSVPYFTSGILSKLQDTLDADARETIRENILNNIHDQRLTDWLDSTRGAEF